MLASGECDQRICKNLFQVIQAVIYYEFLSDTHETLLAVTNTLIILIVSLIV